MSREYDQVDATTRLLNGIMYKLTVLNDSIAALEESVDTSEFTEGQRTEYYRLRSLADAIEQVVASEERKNKPVKFYGKLRKQANGRYEVDRYELSSGSIIDYYDDMYEAYFTSRIEFDSSREDYYIVDLGRSKAIEGVKAIIK